MTELEIMKRAKDYITQLANGINPISGDSVPEDDCINNIRISRCLFYVSGVLEKVIENGGEVGKKSSPKKEKLNLDAVDLSKFSYSDTPIALSVIADKINELIDTEHMSKISYAKIAPILIAAGVLEEITLPDGKTTKRPTDAGKEIGISTVKKTSADGNEYDVVVYNTQAQLFVIDNLYGNI